MAAGRFGGVIFGIPTGVNICTYIHCFPAALAGEIEHCICLRSYSKLTEGFVSSHYIFKSLSK